jgi:hypothetical protein
MNYFTKIFLDDVGRFSKFLIPKGEILVFQKPSNTLDIQIITEKQTYSPGNLVSFDVTVRDRLTQKLITDRDTFISVTVTDDSVFTKVEDRKLPPSIGAAVYLEKEVCKNSNELYYSN